MRSYCNLLSVNSSRLYRGCVLWSVSPLVLLPIGPLVRWRFFGWPNRARSGPRRFRKTRWAEIRQLTTYFVYTNLFEQCTGEMQIIILIFLQIISYYAQKQAIYATFQNFKDKFFRYPPVAVIWGSGNAISLVTTLKHFYFGARPGGRREAALNYFSSYWRKRRDRYIWKGLKSVAPSYTAKTTWKVK